MTAVRYGQTEGALTRAAGLVAGARSDFDGIGAGILADVETMQSRWAGAGARAFWALGQAWGERQGRLVAALDDFERSLRATERDNIATDEHQSGAMAALQHALGALPR